MMPFNHIFIPLGTGLTPHVIAMKSPKQPPKACVVLLHGFPDTNWGWRHLIRPIASSGFDVYAPSMRGYGPYDKPVLNTDEDFTLEKVCQDIEALIVALHLDRIVVVGHDWGGSAAWAFASHYPHRTIAVASFCTPFYPVPSENPWPKMQANPGRFAYQLVFHTDEARRILEADLERTVKCFMRASTDEPISKEDELFQQRLMGLDMINGNVRTINAAPSTTSLSKMHSHGDLNLYVDQFRRSGFLNPLRWYRNIERNWKWNHANIKDKKVTMPALMVTAENDGILTPSMTQNMGKYCTDLELVHIKQASHWVLQEQPEESARALCNWLNTLESKVTLPTSTSKL